MGVEVEVIEETGGENYLARSILSGVVAQQHKGKGANAVSLESNFSFFVKTAHSSS